MIRQIQRCSSTEPYFIQEIQSRTDSRLLYEVHSILPEDPPNEYVCGCPGFRYNGQCAHQMMAWTDRCLWEEMKGPEIQTVDQKELEICPRCGQETCRETIEDET